MSVSVMVVNMRGQPLMPTTPRKARKLLKRGKAKVLQRTPFMVQLRYATGENKQAVKLGLDPGYSQSGFSAITANKELIAGEVQFRRDVSKKLTERRMYRRTRRSNKIRYRPARFENRRRKQGWLAPSIQHKLESHLRFIRRLQRMLPITTITIETATFDTQKLQNPEIQGIEYQHGTLKGYEVKEYLLHKWGRQCAYCGQTTIPLEVEHIIPKSRGGTDRLANLTLSCHDCNQQKGNQTAKEFGFPKIQTQAKESLKALPFMNLVRTRLAEALDCAQTWGYLTKYQRIQLGLPKSHVNDAFVIAGGTTQERCSPYRVHQVRRNNRSLQKNRKGFPRAIRTQRYPYQPYDLVTYNNSPYRVKGTHNKGKRVVVAAQPKNKSVSVTKIELVTYGKGFQFFTAIPPPAKARGFP
ncbi:MAG: RNA-guided endonuclease IscB [Candidatus Hodarchaeales archaeon]